ncbi:DUF6510 family protein [Promicromonospora citrea]|uniref:Uncharacterized protein n=1 Tax=Promicromonospora citrea TaxID=43677 RepID=A0A8H9L140_9MICO|nr:DUF6510 family protein [Promicromonospora citrea]NNH54178.1 hypothetical protein [Promicromonospora citrea]GGM14384.1 hypothetical protein GCM10010102_07310 [Promicromonospora citrea]
MTHHLDGNVLAGALSEIFTADVTTARGRCAGCGRTSPLAEAMVFTDAPGLVARCAGCDQVLATFVDAGDRVMVSLAGLSAVELRR